MRDLVNEKEVNSSRQAAELRRMREELAIMEERITSGECENIHKVTM
jgi:hypothetical protein